MKTKDNFITVQRFDEIKNELNQLVRGQQSFPMEQLPKEMLPVFEKYSVGMTIPVKDGKEYIHYRDFVFFYEMLWTRK